MSFSSLTSTGNSDAAGPRVLLNRFFVGNRSFSRRHQALRNTLMPGQDRAWSIGVCCDGSVGLRV